MTGAGSQAASRPRVRVETLLNRMRRRLAGVLLRRANIAAERLLNMVRDADTP